VNPSAFLRRLKHVVLSHPVLSHPMFQDLDMGHFGVAELRTFSVHYYHHVLRTRLYDAAALAACPHEPIQAALASIVWDEYGHGALARTHPAQFRKVLRALEVDPAEADRAPRLPALESYSRAHFEMCRPETFWRAMGAVGFAMEWPIPYLYEPLVRGYRRIAGLDDDALQFYLEHIPTDEDHSSLMVEVVGPHLDDPHVQGELLEGALTSMDAREGLMQAIYEAMLESARAGAPRPLATPSAAGKGR
jgi:pyrroloquinoline-quinone synthase